MVCQNSESQTVRKGAESFARGRFVAAGLDALAGGVWTSCEQAVASGLRRLTLLAAVYICLHACMIQCCMVRQSAGFPEPASFAVRVSCLVRRHFDAILTFHTVSRFVRSLGCLLMVVVSCLVAECPSCLVSCSVVMPSYLFDRRFRSFSILPSYDQSTFLSRMIDVYPLDQYCQLGPYTPAIVLKGLPQEACDLNGAELTVVLVVLLQHVFLLFSTPQISSRTRYDSYYMAKLACAGV